MLFMVIEHFKDVAAIGERFIAKGRMLPEGVTYHASWVDPSRYRCFQLMEAPDEEALRPWLAVCENLISLRGTCKAKGHHCCCWPASPV